MAAVSEQRRPIYLEDFLPGVVHESPPHKISEEEAIEFARRYDPQYFHLDPEAAKNSAFGELVCGGFQTASLSWALALKSGMFADCPLAGIGIEELRWLAPVRPGETLRCRFSMLDWRVSKTRPDAGVSRMRYELFTADERRVFTMVMIQLMRLRPAAPALEVSGSA